MMQEKEQAMLAQRMGALKREILTAYDARAAALTTLHKATHTHLTRLAEGRAQHAAHQRAALAHDRGELAARVRRALGEEHDTRGAAATQQRAARHTERAGLVSYEAGRRQAATTDLQVKRGDRRAAHQTWQGLAATLHTRRTGARATATPAQATAT
jgi:hypothetical protein